MLSAKITFFCRFAAAIALLISDSGPVLAAERSSGHVELACKILPAGDSRGHEFWRVELRLPSGELLQQELKSTGEKIRFRNLAPGIYVLGILGERGREHSESVDLNLPAGQNFFRFTREIQTPRLVLNQGARHRVSARKLAVPVPAREALRRSELAQLRGDLPEALRQLKRALEVYSDYPEALNNMGVLRRRAQDHQGSIKYFKQADELDPDLYPAWINLGGSFLSLARFTEALEANKRACDLRPGDALPNAQLALNYYYLRNYEEARNYFIRVQAIDPLSASAPLLFLAHIALAQKNESEAEEYIRDYIRLHPNSPQAPRLRQTLTNLSAQGFFPKGALESSSGP